MVELRKERRLRDMSLIDVATAVGVSHQAIQQFERGRKRPTLTTLRRWLRVLGMAVELADEWQKDQLAHRAAEDFLEATGDFHQADRIERLLQRMYRTRKS